MDCIQVECLKFCFILLLRDELHQIARLWNVHGIRPSLNAESPYGRPDVLFFIPEVANARSYKVKVDLDELDIAEEMCCRRLPENSCLEEFTELATTIMHENNLDMPRTGEEATIWGAKRDNIVQLYIYVNQKYIRQPKIYVWQPKIYVRQPKYV